MSLNQELGFDSFARTQENLSTAVKLVGAVAGVALVVKGWDGASDLSNPFAAAAGGLLATPAIVSGILKEAANDAVQLTKNVSMNAGRLAMGFSALVSVTAFPMMSNIITDQREIHDARTAACNGAHEGNITFTFKGQPSNVDCKTMLPPTQTVGNQHPTARI